MNSQDQQAKQIKRASIPLLLKKQLPELSEIEQVIAKLQTQLPASQCRVATLTSIPCKTGRHQYTLPQYAIELGPDDPTVPVIGFFGGVHGLERIGTHLVTHYMNTVNEQLKWDRYINQFLETNRMIFVPLINPGGMLLKRRSNPCGVDLMRNAPIDAEELAFIKLLSGHRISPKLPWYRGTGDHLEMESQALYDFVRSRLFPAAKVISLDVHSGFGVRDRLWFPYAKTKKPFPGIAETYAFLELLEQTYPHNVYKIEPQSTSYTTHGDLWDYFYDEYLAFHAGDLSTHVYVPLSLELGSWLWVKKNPWQLFSPLGAFNPIVYHRKRRVMRRHLTLFDFLVRALYAPAPWNSWNEIERLEAHRSALEAWY